MGLEPRGRADQGKPEVNPTGEEPQETPKPKVIRGKYARAMDWLQRIYRHQPDLFVHWQLVAFTAGRPVGAG
jgi:hypothetical protein